MDAVTFESRIVDWARHQPDSPVLVQIGSRVQPDAVVDAWSDWDFYLISQQPARYAQTRWLADIAPCWTAHFERNIRSTPKVSAVFAGGIEADFVLLKAWHIKLACCAMRHPAWSRLLPATVNRGVANLRLFAGPGHRVLTGSADWKPRLSVLSPPDPGPLFGAAEFAAHVTGFWRHAVWVFKKLAREENRAALRWHQVELMEHLHPILQEEARLDGRPARPEARKAEQWLSPERLQQSHLTLTPDRRALALALLQTLDLFQSSSTAVAARRDFPAPANSEIASWLRSELQTLV